MLVFPLRADSEPKPEGARPWSVVVPCAAQLRPELPAELRMLDCGLSWASSRCRADMLALPCGPRLLLAAAAICAVRPIAGRSEELKPREGWLVAVCAGRCDAAAAGVVWAITGRFSIEVDGLATLPRVAAAPR